MLGISQTCNQPCNHKHNHQSKGDKVVKKEIRSLIKNQSNQWIAIQQEVKQKFIMLKKQIANLQRQVFTNIQKLKQKQAQKQVKLTPEQKLKINKIINEKYEEVTCKQLTQLLKLAKNKTKSDKTSNSKSTISSNRSKINKNKDQKKKYMNSNDSLSQTILNETYLEIKTDIFQNIYQKLKMIINVKQYGQQDLILDKLDLEDSANYQNQSFFSNTQEIQEFNQRLNQLNTNYFQFKNQTQQKQSRIINSTQKEKQNQQSESSYNQYIQMKKKQQGKNVKWALQTQKHQTIKQSVDINMKKPIDINMTKKQRISLSQKQQKIRQKQSEFLRQQKQQEQLNFQSISQQELNKILQNDNFLNEKAELSLYSQIQSQQYESQDSSFLQKDSLQQDYNRNNIHNNSPYLKSAPIFDIQQYQKELQQQIIRQSLRTYEQQNGKQNINANIQNINANIFKNLNQKMFQKSIPQRQNEDMNIYNLLRSMNSTNPLLKKKYISINQLQKQKFIICQNNNKFDILIKVIKPVQLTVVKTVQKSYLKIKFIGADQQSMAIFYTNYDPKIKKDACILLQNCQLNLFKNQYEIACRSHIKPHHFLPPNTIKIRIQHLKNTFSRIRKNYNRQLQYTVPSSEQMKLSECVKTYYRNSNQIQNILLRIINPCRINKQVIVCILNRGQNRDQFIVGDYSGRIYARIPSSINAAIGDTIMLIRPIIYAQQNFRSQKIFLHAQRMLNFARIGFQFDKSQIPNIMLNKENVQ